MVLSSYSPYLSWRQSKRKIGLIGLMGAGKDYTAERAGYRKLGFADPIYALAKYYFGTDYKKIPGMRQWMQEVGQWGWGKIDSDCPVSAVRSATIESVRRVGPLLEGFEGVAWREFGLRRDFWVESLLERYKSYDSEKVAVVNVRFLHELEPLGKKGFTFYVVVSTDEERYERLQRTFDKRLDCDTSEQMAKEILGDLELGRMKMNVIWNSRYSFTESKYYREDIQAKVQTVDSFVEETKDL